MLECSMLVVVYKCQALEILEKSINYLEFTRAGNVQRILEYLQAKCARVALNFPELGQASTLGLVLGSW